ncbi:MAG: heme-binding protein [Pseudomonadota bacterium]
MSTQWTSWTRSTGMGIAAFCLTLMAGCGGGSTSTEPGTAEPPPDTTQNRGCDGSCATANSFLSETQVQQIIAQAVAEANALGSPATIAVVDRPGNVLAVFQMTGAPAATRIFSGKGAIGGLEEIAIIPSTLSAIAKAVTGAYLSSEGNGFTTRTASQIVQEHFNPGEINQPGGPLFGVQFSQLACSDFMQRFDAGGATPPGPKRSPLGLSADPGGMPLYIDGVPVGGIGIESDGNYTADLSIADFDRDPDELIAVAGSFGFAPPADRQADRITVDGKTFRFADVGPADLSTDPASAAGFGSVNGPLGGLVAVTGYTNGDVIRGTAFGQPESGIRPDTGDYPGLDAFVLVDENNQNRFPPRAGTDGANAMTENEVRVLLQEALRVANSARAQIRRPVGSQARVSISIVDTNGVILGIARTRDAPIFGLDVSLQKSRTANFFSGAFAGDDLRGAPDANYINSSLEVTESIPIGSYVTAAQDFLEMPTALDDGAFAFADRSGGNLSRPYFPDGIVGTENGPFSKPFPLWSPFSVGLQLDLVYNQVIGHVAFVAGVTGTDVTNNCTTIGRLPNGIQIFPGSVPVYRGNTLIGGIGVSGDGIDQDDMISFLGLHNAGEILGTINNAPPEIRADNLTPRGVRLRYIQCPQSPFLDSSEINPCEGK